MNIAIVGSGISGLYAAHRLRSEHKITVFEAGSYAGGHTNTIDVEIGNQTLAIDTGFIVFNERNYPRFKALLDELDVDYQRSDMTFSFKCEETGLEYNGSDVLGLFAQRRNLLRPSFYRMLRDILRFNKASNALVNAPPDITLGRYLDDMGFAGPVVEDYLLPMAGAIWSSQPDMIRAFPARQFGHFFHNHGLLQLNDRPRWMTISGGARQYVRALTRELEGQVLLNTPVEWIQRFGDSVLIKPSGLDPQRFDHVIIACHSDQALKILRDPSPEETGILGAIAYQPNEAILHTDVSLLPSRPRAWAAWNYHRLANHRGKVTVSYNLSTLQALPTNTQFLVTLNARNSINPANIIRRIEYMHPVYNLDTIAAQQRRSEINGRRRTWYCGAYWGYGFHEDGVNSAATVCDAIDRTYADEKLYLSRAS